MLSDSIPIRPDAPRTDDPVAGVTDPLAPILVVRSAAGTWLYITAYPDGKINRGKARGLLQHGPLYIDVFSKK